MPIYLFELHNIHLVRLVEMSLLQVAQHLETILQEWMLERPVSSGEFVKEEENYERQQFKIKIKKKSIDVFAVGQVPIYFENYLHLFKTIQKISQKAKNTVLVVEQLANTIKQTMKPFIVEDSIIHKIDDRNEWICINEIIQDILQELNDPQYQFIKEVQQQFLGMRRKTIPQLMNLAIKRWESQVTSILQKRRASKQAIQCSVADWITLQFVLPTQTKIIQCLQEIEKWRKQHRVAIIWSSEGSLQNSGKLNLKLAVEEFGCMIKLRISHRVTRVERLRVILEEIIHPQRNIVFNTFLHVNKHSQNFIITCLKGIDTRIAHLRSQGEKDIDNILQNIQCVSNLDKILQYQKVRFSESCINHRVHSPSRLFTEIQTHFANTHQTKIQQTVSQSSKTSINFVFQSIKEALVDTYSENDINYEPSHSQQDQKETNFRLNSLTRRSMLVRPGKKYQTFIEEQRGEEESEDNQVSFRNVRLRRSNSEKELERPVEELMPQHPSMESILAQRESQNIRQERDQLKREIQQMRKHPKCNCHLQITRKDQQIYVLNNQLQASIQQTHQLNAKIMQIIKERQATNTELEQLNKQVGDQRKSNAQKIRNLESQIMIQSSLIDKLNSELLCHQKQKANEQQKLLKLIQDKQNLIVQSTASWKQTQNKLIQTIIRLQTEKHGLSAKLNQYSHSNSTIKMQLESEQTQCSSILLTSFQNQTKMQQQISDLITKNQQLKGKNQQLTNSLLSMKEAKEALLIKQRESDESIERLVESQKSLREQLDMVTKHYEQSSTKITKVCSEFSMESSLSSKRLEYFKTLFTLLFFVVIGTSFTIRHFRRGEDQ